MSFDSTDRKDEIVLDTSIPIDKNNSLTNDNVKKNLNYYRRKIYNKFTTREGWIGDYDYAYLFTPNIYPFNKKYKNYIQPYFGKDDSLPIILAIILGFQHCFTLICSLVAVPLLIGDAYYLSASQTQHLVSCCLITAGIATFGQIARLKIYGTNYYIGTGLLSVVGNTFDIVGIAYSYSSKLYNNGTCTYDSNGVANPCIDAIGGMAGTMLVTVWIQVLMAFVPPKWLKKVFPNMVTGTLLLLLAIYLAGNGMKNWGGGSGCYESDYSCAGNNVKIWGHRAYIGLGFCTFISIVLFDLLGSPLMRSASVILGLLVGCIVSAACGYWDASGIHAAPAGDFLWTQNYKYSVEGTLVLPFLIMFIVEGVSCIPDILATAEASKVPIEGVEFQSRVQGGIMCDALGSLLSGCACALPMVSQAANNGVIYVTNNASRYSGYIAAVILVLLGIFSKIAATFTALPHAVFGGMQVFLFGTIGVAGVKILQTVPWNRRNRFILSCGLGWGFAACVIQDWFDLVFDYSGNNQRLAGFLQGIELVIETPFILGALISCVLNLIVPGDYLEPEFNQRSEIQELQSLS